MRCLSIGCDALQVCFCGFLFILMCSRLRYYCAMLGWVAQYESTEKDAISWLK